MSCNCHCHLQDHERPELQCRCIKHCVHCCTRGDCAEHAAAPVATEPETIDSILQEWWAQEVTDVQCNEER